MPSSMAVVLNCSSHSHRAARQRERVAELLHASGLEADVMCAENGRRVAELAKRAVRQHYRTIVAGGGDGTMSAVAAAVVGTEKTMGVLPLGTINHFAKYLGIPTDLEGAVRTLGEGQPARIDVGEVNGRVFVNNSTLGIYPHIVHHREQLRERHGLNKWLAFAVAVATGLRRHELLRLRLMTDDLDIVLITPFVFVANSDFKLGAIGLGPEGPLGPGELGVCVAQTQSRLEMAGLIASAAAGRIEKAERFRIMRTRQLWVETASRRLHVAADGEIFKLHAPLRYRSRPVALSVFVPRLAEGKG